MAEAICQMISVEMPHDKTLLTGSLSGVISFDQINMDDSLPK